MDDDRKKPPRGKGPRAGGKNPGTRKAGGTDSYGAAKGKPGPGGKRSAGGFAKKPFKPRDPAAGAFEERPARKFDGERGGGPREGGKPREKRPGGFDKKPFKPREGEASNASSERPARKFEGERGAGPREGRKPYEKRAVGFDKKPFKPREGEASNASSERPARKFEGERGAGPREGRKPYEKRPGGFDKKPFKPREGSTTARPERAERPYRGDGSQGEKPFFKRRDEAGGEGRPERKFARVERPAGSDAERPERPFRAGPPRGGKPLERTGADRKPAGERKPFRSDATEVASGERIAKRLARVGIASRRDAEELIAAGRVRVNGVVLSSPAFNVQIEDRIELDGTEIPPIERTRLFLFHKPAGVVTTNRDPEGRKTVFDVLPAELPRLMTVGRLDINTEGLLLLTNDGGLSRVLELPATGWLRRYRVRVHGKVDEAMLADLKDGIAVDGTFYGGIEASLDREQGTNAWLTLGLREGKNREVKNVLGALGLDVTRLIRISYGPFQLNELPEGHVVEIKGRMLRDQLGERLIEESGANFEADIAKPFSNKPVRRDDRAADEQTVERPRNTRDGERGKIGEGGLIKARKRRENTRDQALGKLSTRPQGGKKFGDKKFGGKGSSDKFGGRPARGGKGGGRDERPIEAPAPRKANVWMAPGARPIGKGRAEAEASDAARARKDRNAKSGSGTGGKPSFAKDDRPRAEGPKGPRRGKNDADRRR